MRVEKLSSKKQRFNGKNYYLCGFYYQKRGIRLHRVVWEHFKGKIPKGYHVHHKDEDRNNNQIGNLELLTKSKHLSHHMQERLADPKQRKKLVDHITSQQGKAAKWHGSPEGLEWHRQHSSTIRPPRFECVCQICEKSFLAKQRSAMFCSGKCNQQDFRNRNPGYICPKRKKARL